MDGEFRKQWDSTLVVQEQLDLCEETGTEVGRIVKKFPLLTPREYVLAWRVWEGEDSTFYCFIKVFSGPPLSSLFFCGSFLLLNACHASRHVNTSWCRGRPSSNVSKFTPLAGG